jgi:predicted NBD/HSP70 family sugar kinase
VTVHSGDPDTGQRPRWPELNNGQRRVLLELLLHGEHPRTRLAERVGLSRASLTRIARELVDLGLVLEGDSLEPNGRGRPAEMLHLRGDAAHFLGVKLTGDTLFAVVTDLSGDIVTQRTEPLTRRDVQGVVQQITSLVADLAGTVTIPAAIGVCAAGDVQHQPEDDILRDSRYLGWSSVPLSKLITEATGLPVTLMNDVHALVSAHHWFGSGKGRDPLVVYGVGAGIGMGVVVHGQLLEGNHGRSGRVGHLRLGGEGRRCSNGHMDCVHAYVTIPSVEHNAGVPRGKYQLALDRARAGDERALRAFGDAAYALGAAVAESVNAFDPELLSLMGEGLAMLDLAPTEFQRGLEEFLERLPPAEVLVERPGFEFGLYARGAAVAAERQLLT